jgi:hypothetical protein
MKPRIFIYIFIKYVLQTSKEFFARNKGTVFIENSRGTKLRIIGSLPNISPAKFTHMFVTYIEFLSLALHVICRCKVPVSTEDFPKVKDNVA